MSTAAPRRWSRALALAATATAVGAGSHLLVGGRLSVPGALAALPVLTALAWPLTGRERGWVAILGVQLAGQQAAHLLFGLGAGPHGSTVPVDAWFYAHIAAAVVVTTWLRGAERRAWAAARRAAAALTTYWRHLLVLLDRPEAGHPQPVRAPAEAVPARPARPLRHSVVRRGPPLPA